jgi:hypothetical protein
MDLSPAPPLALEKKERRCRLPTRQRNEEVQESSEEEEGGAKQRKEYQAQPRRRALRGRWARGIGARGAQGI